MNTPKYPEIEVQLTGNDGNAFVILSAVMYALRRELGNDAAQDYYQAATEGDYDHLLQVTMQTVTVS